jgi:hypothetical protein
MSREEVLATLGELSETGGGWINDGITSQQLFVMAGTSTTIWTSTTQSNSGGANAYLKGWNPSTYITGGGKGGSSYKMYVFDATSLISAP